MLGMWAFAFLTVLSAQVRIPLPFTPVPMTLQTFIVPLAGGFLGAGWGSASILLYVLLGLLGFPVFAGAATGSQMFVAPTAGFLVGFVAAAAIVGIARDRKFNNLQMLLALIVSHVVILAFGYAGFLITTNATPQEAFAKAVLPFLAGDVLKIAASYLVLFSYIKFRKATNL